MLPGPGIINTVAGGGTGGLGDGGLATSATLQAPEGVAVDAQGNIYIADSQNNRIRKVTASTGDIATVAGSVNGGFSGDGGLATSAELDTPTAVAVDAQGNIYIADEGNSRIRKVTAGTGIISTVAGGGTGGLGDGGPATSAELSQPVGVALDAQGNIYIGDTYDQRVRVVNTGTAQITIATIPISAGDIATVAGNGTAGSSGSGIAAISAELHQPSGVAVDTFGNIYIADIYNNLIREVAASTGNIYTVAGTGTGGFSGDGGSATGARLDEPFSVAVDSAGNIYVADVNSNRIRKVTAYTGDISTVAGSSATGGFSGDGGAATSAKLNGPYGVAVDAVGNIYIADTGNNRIRAVGHPVPVALPADIINTVAGDGTAGFSGDGGTATVADLYGPTGVAVDAAGNIYIADASNNRIRKVTASTGYISTVAGMTYTGKGCSFSGDGGLATSAELCSPTGVAVDSAGNIYVADRGNNRIRVVNTQSGQIKIAGVTIQPNDIETVAGDGTRGCTGGGTTACPGSGMAATSAELNLSYTVVAGRAGVAVDANFNIYIADMGNNLIRAVNSGTSAVTIAGVLIQPGDIATVAGDGTRGFSGDGGLAINAELLVPRGVGVDANFNIYIADSGNCRIRKVTASGIISTVAGDASGPLSQCGFSGDGGLATSATLYAWDVAVDIAGDIYVADWGNMRIRKVTASTGEISTVAGDGTAGYNGDNITATSAELYEPYGVAVDIAGNIYIADTENNRIRAVGQ